jgi:hypothetical protein
MAVLPPYAGCAIKMRFAQGANDQTVKWVNRVQRGAKVIAGCVFVTVVVVGLTALACANIKAGNEQESRPTSLRVSTGNSHGAEATLLGGRATFELCQAVESASLDETGLSRRRVHALAESAHSRSADTTRVMIITAAATVALGYSAVRFVSQAGRLMADAARCMADVELANTARAAGRRK